MFDALRGEQKAWYSYPYVGSLFAYSQRHMVWRRWRLVMVCEKLALRVGWKVGLSRRMEFVASCSGISPPGR